MKIIIAPDSFKESLSAADAGAAMAAGVLEVCPKAIIDLCPMADGGEGTLDAMVAATGGKILTADVFDPLGSPVRARFALLGDDRETMLPGQIGLLASLEKSDGRGEQGKNVRRTVAVIEMASASGLSLVRADQRDPMKATSYGTGQLILAALDAGAERIIIGLGGSATVDGGYGCAQAMGVTFISDDGNSSRYGLGGGDLEYISRFDITTRDPRLSKVKIHAACDVTNPLVGDNGAAAVFGPQKGATEEMVEKLQAGLEHLAELIRNQLGIDVSDLGRAGAAGGLAAGLVAFADATLEDGFSVVAEAVGFENRLKEADLCLTGEGMFDGQSLAGKTTVSIAQMARKLSVPTVCIPGQAGIDAPRDVFRSIKPLVCGSVTVQQAMSQTATLLAQQSAEAIKEFLGDA